MFRSLAETIETDSEELGVGAEVPTHLGHKDTTFI
jgi:hypothetical protein